jgi:hypothetical protein
MKCEAREEDAMEATSSLDYAQRKLAIHEAAADAWRHIVEGLRGLNGEAPQFVIDQAEEAEAEAAAPSVPETRPKGMEAVRLIVTERPGRWTLRELREEFERRGWLHTTDKRRAYAAVDAAAWRMAKLGEARAIEPGVYEFPATATQGVLDE